MSDVTETEETVVIAARGLRGESAGALAHLTTARVVRDVSRKRIHIPPAATIVPASAKIGTPVEEMIVTGTVEIVTAAIADDAISMIDPDEICSRIDPGVAVIGTEVAGTAAIVEVTGENKLDGALHLQERRSPLLT